MAYIYQITNDVNGKIYIGKSVRDIKYRWKEHLRDSFRKESRNQPLYLAMRKYGPEHFHIEVIEEVLSDESLEDREKYWIERKRSFKEGYNATIGGDGKPYLDYDLIISTYQEVQNEKMIAEKLGISISSVQRVLYSYKIPRKTQQEVMRELYGNVINQYDKNGKFIQSFPSATEAAKAIKGRDLTNRGCISHITGCCKGKQKTAYGYIWKYAKEVAR